MNTYMTLFQPVIDDRAMDETMKEVERMWNIMYSFKPTTIRENTTISLLLNIADNAQSRYINPSRRIR